MKTSNLPGHWLGVGILALTLVGCTSQVPSVEAGSDSQVVLRADYPVYDSLDDASQKADLIVKGEFVDSRVEMLFPVVESDGTEESNPQLGVSDEDISIEDMAVVTTVSRIRVSEVLKGDVEPGHVIEVSQLGGLVDKTNFEEEHTTLLKSVSAPEVALLLNTVGPNRFDLINPTQGVFTVVGEQATPLRFPETFREVTSLSVLRATVEQ